MPEDREPSHSRRLPAESARRIREGSAQGAALVSSEFAAVLTRRRFCELVGIHKTTLRRWEAAGVVRPEMQSVLSIRTAVFPEADVTIGREIVRLLAENSGRLSLKEAAEIARREGAS